MLVLRGSLDRESLRLGVVRLPTPEQRLGWLADHLAEQPGSGIVYCLTVAATQEIADYLRSRGHDVAAYSGQTDPTERLALEEQLAPGRIKALVATSALGMGFDATLGFVVNMGAPQSPVAYYQQVGRAGRGTDRASVVLLPQPEDRDIWAYFASLAFPREDQVRHTLRVLAEEGRPLSTATLETYVDLGRTRLEQMLKVLDVDGAVRRVRGGWEATGQPWTYDAERYARVSEARKREQQAMLDYLDTDRCRMWFLRDQLDDPDIEGRTTCGRCDSCGGEALSTAGLRRRGGRGAGAAGPAGRRGRAAEHVADRAGQPRPRAQGPDRRRGRARAGRRPAHRPGSRAGAARAVRGRAARQRAARLPGPRRDRGAPGLAPRVDGIVVVESVTRPTLTADLADGLSRYLRRPVVARWAIADPTVEPGQGAVNSAQRVAAVSRRFRLEGEVPSGPVLLVDDQVVTGWTLTVAARALREAGATAVLPLVLAARS